MFEFRIRFADSGPDVVLKLQEGQSDAIHDLKELLKASDSRLADKHLRLMYRGRILSDTERASALAIDDSTSLFLHCSVSDQISDNHSNTTNNEDLPQGFDRLLQLGMSQQDVANFRTEFHALRGTDLEDTPEAARSAEEEWMSNPVTDGQDEPLANEGSDYDWIYGALIGFFGGIISLFWLREVFNRRQQIGLLMGLWANVVIGFLYYLDLLI